MLANRAEVSPGFSTVQRRPAWWAIVASLLAILFSLAGITVVVYLAGTKSVATHLYYLPIIYAGYFFGDYGALVTLLLAAALTAYGAPAEVLEDGTTVAQAPTDVIVRAFAFFVVGMVSSRTSMELRRRAAEFRTLYEVAQSISSTLRVRQVLELIAKHALSVVEARGCSIRLYRPDTGELELVAMEGLNDAYWGKGPVRVEDSPVDQRAMAGEVVLIEDAARAELFQYPGAAREAGIGAVLTVPLRSKDEVLGVMRVYSARPGRFPARQVDLVTTFATQAAIAIENAELYEDIRRNYYETVRALTSAIEARDQATYRHSERVTTLTVALAEEMGLSPEEIELVQFGSILHDIGKIGLESQTAGAPGSTEEVLYRMHPLIGMSILQPITFLKPVLCMIGHHHERWDGTGFPEGLAGKDIPFYARLVAATDAYERCLNPRDPDRPGMEPDDALEEVTAGASSQFDPEVVAAFRRLMRKRPDLHVPPMREIPLPPSPIFGEDTDNPYRREIGPQ